MTGSPGRSVMFAGHLLDAPGRADVRFPPGLEATVTRAIVDALDRLRPAQGFVSAACGSDILFVEAMVARGAEVTVLLPFARESFVATSVAYAGERWLARFDAALAAARRTATAVAGPHRGDDMLFAYASDLLQGLARLDAKRRGAECSMLAVADGEAPGGIGGTRGSLRRWQETGGQASVIDLAALRGGAAAGDGRSAVERAPSPPTRRIAALLHAGGPSAESASAGSVVEFADVGEAAEAAIAACAGEPGARMALHVDALTPGDAEPFRAGARLARVAAPGRPLATEAAAATLLATSTRFRCEPTGVAAEALGGGRAPAYLVSRAD